MGCAFVVGSYCAMHVAALEYHPDVATTHTIVSVDDALAEELWNACIGDVVIIYHVCELWVLLQQGNSFLFHFLQVEMVLLDESMVKIYAAVHDMCHIVAFFSKCACQMLVQLFFHRL